MLAPAGFRRSEILGFSIPSLHFLVINSYQFVWEALLSLCHSHSPKEGGEGRIKTRFMDLIRVSAEFDCQSPHVHIFSSFACIANL